MPFTLERKPKTYIQDGKWMNIKVDPATYGTLRGLSAETDMSMSELARRSVAYAVENLEWATKKLPTGGQSDQQQTKNESSVLYTGGAKMSTEQSTEPTITISIPLTNNKDLRAYFADCETQSLIADWFIDNPDIMHRFMTENEFDFRAWLLGNPKERANV